MALRSPSALAMTAAICAALASSISPALSQEPDWAPLRQAQAAAPSFPPGEPISVGRPATAPAPLDESSPAFDLPSARLPAPPAEGDFHSSFADAAATQLDEVAPPPMPIVVRPADHSWTSPFKQPAGTPWLTQPLSFSKFAGGFGSNEPIENRLETGIGLATGVRTCWDFAPRWGVESRLGFARTSLGSPGPGQLASHENFWFWDAEFVFYPWPDTLWRPFVFAGSGMTDVRYIDQAGIHLHQSLFHIPLGIGIKRQIYGEHAFRIDIGDNLLFTDIRPREYIHSVSIVAGFEFRFGGRWKWLNSLPTD